MTPPSGAMSLASSMFDRCAFCVINDRDVLPDLDERPITSVRLHGGKRAVTYASQLAKVLLAHSTWV